MLSTVLKAGQVLSLFERQNPEWGVSQVAATLNIPKSSAHELLSTLTKIGLLRQIENGRYRLGWGLFSLSQVLLDTTQFRDEARQMMEQLAAQYQETVHLAVLDGTMVTYADKLQGHQAVQVGLTGVGFRLNAHCSAVGKVLLADLPWSEACRILAEQDMTEFTPNTITSITELQKELERVRRQGYAYDLEEAMTDLCCVAAPIRDHTGQVIAAMSMSVPAYRFHRSKLEYRQAIVRACHNVSERLGYLPHVTAYRSKKTHGRNSI
jgi:IclR family KDG regulon transcriptional repressor